MVGFLWSFSLHDVYLVWFFKVYYKELDKGLSQPTNIMQLTMH